MQRPGGCRVIENVPSSSPHSPARTPSSIAFCVVLVTISHTATAPRATATANTTPRNTTPRVRGGVVGAAWHPDQFRQSSKRLRDRHELPSVIGMATPFVGARIDPGALEQQSGDDQQDRGGEQQHAHFRVVGSPRRTVLASGSTRTSRPTAAPATPAATSDDALPSATHRAMAIAVIGFACGSWRTAARPDGRAPTRPRRAPPAARGTTNFSGGSEP